MKKKVKEMASMLFALWLSACLLAACGGNGKITGSSSETKTETEITASAEDDQEDSRKEGSETEETKTVPGISLIICLRSSSFSGFGAM